MFGSSAPSSSPFPHPLASAPHSPDYMILVIMYLFS